MPPPSPNVRAHGLTPEYRYNERLGRYITADGRMVPFSSVKGALEGVVTRAGENIGDLAKRLQAGQIPLADWQRQMAQELKLLHTASAAAARGGWAQMSPADWGRTGRIIRDQYSFLQRFALEVESGKQKLDGTFLRRSKMYADAARTTFEIQRRQNEIIRGKRLEKNVLGVADHCRECLAETARGWVPIGSLSPPGTRTCKTNCACTLDFSVEEAQVKAA